MPRSRVSEMPQRQSPRAPLHLRTSGSDSDSPHHRHVTDPSPKVGGGRRSPRRAQSDPALLNQKKLGTRIADLESQLGQAQEELKSLKEQLATAEAAKKEAQEKLEKTAEKHPPPAEIQSSNENGGVHGDGVPGHNLQDNDASEGAITTVSDDQNSEHIQPPDQTEKESNLGKSTEAGIFEAETPSSGGIKMDELRLLLKASLEEKEKKLELFSQENESLKKRLSAATTETSSVRAAEKEMALKLRQVREELGASKTNAAETREQLEAVERVKAAMEVEMKKLSVQTDQWRKAADAAAAVLAEGVDANEKIGERCRSMDKHSGSFFDAPAVGYAGFVGSPGMAEDSDDGFGATKRKGGGIRMFGELWKKKGHKQ